MRILLVRLDGLGDTVLTTPLFRLLGDAAITCIASPAGAACLEGHPALEQVIAVDVRRTSVGEKLALGRRLRAMRFDVAITVTEKAWGYIWAWQSAAPRRIGFWAGATQPVKALLFRPTLTDRIASPNDPSQPSAAHEVERIAGLAAPLGIQAAPGPLWLPAHPTPRPHDPRPLALHLSAKWLADGWTEAWIVELVEALAALSPAGVRISAGPAEAGWAAPLLARLPAERLDTATFARWCAALRSCAGLVTMDTGAVHVAAALGLPVVDVFPREGHAHTVPRWLPWQVPHEVVLRGRGDDPGEAVRVREEILRAGRTFLGHVHVA